MDNSIDYKGQIFELLTFGYGRRGCPGIYMAIPTIELTLANLLYYFNWKLLDGMKEECTNMEERDGLSLTTSICQHSSPHFFLSPIPLHSKYNDIY